MGSPYNGVAQVEVDTLEAYGLYQRADSLLFHAQFELSIGYFEEASELYKKEDQWHRYFNCLNKISKNYWKSDSYPESMSAAQEVIDLSPKKLGPDNLELASAYHNLAVVLRVKGQPYDGYDYETLSKDIFLERLGPKSIRVANSFNSLAGSLFGMGKLDSSRVMLKKAINIMDASDLLESKKGGAMLNNLANIYWKLGHLDSSILYNQIALNIRKNLFDPNNPNIANSYNALGLNYMIIGQYSTALEYLTKGLEILSLNYQKHSALANTIENIGLIHLEMGSYELAENFLKKSLNMRKELFGPYHREVSNNLNNLAMMFQKTGRLDSATFYYQRSHQIISALSRDSPYYLEVEVLNNLGLSSIERGYYSMGVSQLTRALGISLSSQSKYNPYASFTYFNLAGAELSEKRYFKAQEYINLSIEKDYLFSRIDNFSQNKDNNPIHNNHSLKARILAAHIQKKLYEASSDLESLVKAMHYHYQCDSIIDGTRSNKKKYKDKIDFTKMTFQVYENAIGNSLILYNATDSINYLKKAFYFAEKSKSGILSDALNDLSAKSFGMIPDSLLQLERVLKTDQAYYHTQLKNERTWNLTHDTVKLSQWSDQLFQTNRRVDSLLLKFEKDHPKYYELKYRTQQLNIHQVQSQLPEGAALLEYFTGDSSTYVFVVTKSAFEVFDLEGGAAKVSADVSYFRELLEKSAVGNITDRTAFQEQSYTLYQKYLEPGLMDMPSDISALVIIPDGPLSYIPFDILLTSAPDSLPQSSSPEGYLIKDYTLQYGYSAELLFGQGSGEGVSNGERRGLLAFAPSYDGLSKDSVRGRTLGKFRSQVSPLKWNGPEVDEIRKLTNGTVLIGQEAKEEAFKNLVGDHNIIHLAMHALVDDEDPMNSRLVFTQSSDSLEDNFLHAYELYNMEVPADLAVLSGCETGFGKMARGEGVMSLARAFSYAGCPSVVMSHWSVNDAATAKLMGYFYEFLSQGKAKDVSLRLAKLRFLEQADQAQSNPYYWGSFVVMGNTDPVQFDNKSYSSYLVIGLILGFLMAVILWVRQRRGDQV